jgi:uncharacterized membrane protein
MLYLALKSLHIVAVVLFLGNIITGAFWKAHADRTGDLRARAQALDGLVRSDRVFTAPGVFLIIATGVALVFVGNLSFQTFWVLWSIVLFGAAGALFGARVGPLQKKLLSNAQAGLAGQWNEAEYHALSRRLNVWGLTATVLPLIALVFMVIKPV